MAFIFFSPTVYTCEHPPTSIIATKTDIFRIITHHLLFTQKMVRGVKEITIQMTPMAFGENPVVWPTAPRFLSRDIYL